MLERVQGKRLDCRRPSGNDGSVNGLGCSPLPLTAIARSAKRGGNSHDCVAQGSSVALAVCSLNHLGRRNDRMAKIQFELPDEKLAELEALQKESRLETRKDLFNTALTLFEWAVDEVKAGRSIASVDEENKRYREIVMPALRAVAPTTANGSKRKNS